MDGVLTGGGRAYSFVACLTCSHLTHIAFEAEHGRGEVGGGVLSLCIAVVE